MSANLRVFCLTTAKLNARALDIEVWLPEPVLWELVSHVADAVGDVISVHTETTNKLERAGLTPYSPHRSRNFRSSPAPLKAFVSKTMPRRARGLKFGHS